MNEEQREVAERLVADQSSSNLEWSRQVVALLRELLAEPVQEPMVCQYAQDVGMPEYRCVGKCQYAEPQGEPVAVEYRWTNPGDLPYQPPEILTWNRVEPDWRVGQSLQQRVDELLAYRADGKPCYEMRYLYIHPPQQRKPLLLEAVRDLVKECGLDWHRGFMPLFKGDETNRFAVLVEAVECAHGITGEPT